MVFPISFSSFGDIVTAADLALRIAKALSSSTGSSYEYQYLVQEINALAHALRLADAATRTGILKQDIVNGLLAEIARCREVMDALWERIRGYQKALGKQRDSSHGSWRKIGWALFKTQDVQETRLKLATHRANLITLMTACNMTSIDEIKTQCARVEQTVHMRLNEIYTVVCQLPSKLGYSNKNAIRILDWRGNETLLPEYLCETRPQFLTALNALAFKWPPYIQTHIRHGPSFFVCEEKQWLLDNLKPQSFKSNVVAGNTIRLTTLVLQNFPRGWGPNYVTIMPFQMQYPFCEECRRSGRPSLIASYESFNKNLSVLHMGCDPAYALWSATVEVRTVDKVVQHVYTFHDPLNEKCAWSHTGISIALLTPCREDEPHCKLNAMVRVRRGSEFPYIFA